MLMVQAEFIVLTEGDDRLAMTFDGMAAINAHRHERSAPIYSARNAPGGSPAWWHHQK